MHGVSGGQEESTADSGAGKSGTHPEDDVSPVKEVVCKPVTNRWCLRFVTWDAFGSYCIPCTLLTEMFTGLLNADPMP